MDDTVADANSASTSVGATVDATAEVTEDATEVAGGPLVVSTDPVVVTTSEPDQAQLPVEPEPMAEVDTPESTTLSPSDQELSASEPAPTTPEEPVVIEKIIEREVIKEVPVEKIVEVEKLVEKIVEKEVVKEVIKEVVKEVVKEVPAVCPPPTEEEITAIHKDFLIRLSKEGTIKRHALMEEKLDRIVALLDTKSSITHKDVMEHLECSGTTATRLLTELRHDGRLILHGSSPHTYSYTRP